MERFQGEYENKKTLNVSCKGRDAFVAHLPAAEQAEYLEMLQYFETSEEMNRRNLGLSTFKSHLERVYKFIHKGDRLDIYRGFVCGIEFGANFILVNTKRLRVLMNRSKSCVNGCLQKLGYTISRQQQDISGFFGAVLPGINQVFCNSRQWCIRIPNSKSDHIFEANLPDHIVKTYGIAPCKATHVQHREPLRNIQAPLVFSYQQFPYVQFPSEIETERKEMEVPKNPLWDINLLLNRHNQVECVQV